MNPNKDHKLQVEAIKNGTVIDHIPAGMAIQILKLFHIEQGKQRITLGLNLPSSAQGAKDLIKIEDLYVSEEQANQLALHAPKATVNQIENYAVVKKMTLSLPKEVLGVFQCCNNNCITHLEPVDSRFYVLQKHEEVHLKCHYCEKVFPRKIVTDRQN
ncbi:Aspartate carbamoyltransferase regulatory chain [Vibrio stylophorae]|uniref:Aspartate carbamoyltransferase regulatory chain n=1 Tax=Vibrio stylophorae TaxID=659351 RepID=A0ABN8DUH2_9VIBR|nr:aspartate carbamoyltransferase regulatory subunit [Vibrio stylophorae]CAH0534422.1 Aspartate carbamoyltransferase regulatory chain [Vibrio stylophorae]